MVTTAPALSMSGQLLPPDPPKMLNRVIRGKKAWTRATIRETDYILPISQACLDCIDHPSLGLVPTP